MNAVNSQGALAGKFLTFALSSENYGIEILKVQEIIKVPQITTVPRCPEYIMGVINLRGKIIPVLDLRLKFNIAPKPYDEKTCIVVVNIDGSGPRLSVGVIVDTVLEVMNFAATDIEPAPNYGATLDSRFILGMGKRELNLNILIDIERVILEDGPIQVSHENA